MARSVFRAKPCWKDGRWNKLKHPIGQAAAGATGATETIDAGNASPNQENAMEEIVAEVKIEQEPGGPRPQAARWLLRALREVAETVIPAVVIALIINLFLAQATQVLGQSMEPNLHTAQRVVVEKVTYRFFHGPQRGDIVVIDLPEQSDMLIKRVIGLPGETIEVRGGEVFIEGEQLEEAWTVNSGGGNYGPKTIPPLQVFVMGDNRGASNDSRNFGPVHIEYIVGHAWFSYWPTEYVGFVE
ncbi:MAG: signal peptidase I [Chloroflexi bacterium]|nr:MAG: signal peptidase I [Chloroflexota bacterium]